MFMYWRAFPVGSRHISVQFYVCKTTWYASAALLLRANWNEIWSRTAPFYNACPLQRWSPHDGNCVKTILKDPNPNCQWSNVRLTWSIYRSLLSHPVCVANQKQPHVKVLALGQAYLKGREMGTRWHQVSQHKAQTMAWTHPALFWSSKKWLKDLLKKAEHLSAKFVC